MGNEISRIVANYSLKPINPMQCGYEKCASHHDFGPAAREYWLLHFVASGRGKFRTDRGEYRLSAGDIFIIHPYEITYYKADKREPWEYYWLAFTADMPMPQTLVSADVIHAPRIGELFVSAFKNSDFDDGNTSVGAYEHYLCGVIWQLLGYAMAQSPAPTTNAEGYVKVAVSVIESEYASGITVSELARRLHLNRSYFSVIFRQITGKTPGKYLTDYRMIRAKEFLTLREYTVGVTATSVGYPDVFTFSRAFKHHYGYSPTEAKSRP